MHMTAMCKFAGMYINRHYMHIAILLNGAWLILKNVVNKLRLVSPQRF